MSTGKKFLLNKKNISLGVVGLFLIMAFAGINFFPDTEGSEAAVSAPIASSARLEGELDMYHGDTADQMFEHSTQYSYLGSTVASGDINGDGFDDYIMTAYGAGSYSGELYVYFGVINVKAKYSPSGDANITVTGSGRGYLGYGLDTGDFNGDGIDDILVGAYYGGSSQYGEAYIIFGKTTWADKTSMSVTKADVTFKGEKGQYYRSNFGMQCSSGDIDGDGMDEPIIYAPYFASGYQYGYHGRVYVWWGRSSWASQYDTASDQYDFSIDGRQSSYSYAYGYLGMYGYSKPADFNGDGADELLIGSSYEYYYSSATSSYSNYGSGAVHMLEGTPGNRSLWTGDIELRNLASGSSSYPKQHWLYSRTNYEYFGMCAFGADMNKDGNMDLVVSKGTSTGTAYIFWGDGDLDSFGGATWSTRLRYNYHSNYTVISGPTQITVADLDRDGYGDLIGGTYYTSSTSYSGVVWVWYGSDDWSGRNKNNANYTITGNSYDYLGYYYLSPSIKTGDFNVDGYPDLILGAYQHRTNLYGVGAVYIKLTQPPETNVNTMELMDGDGENQDTFCIEAGGNRFEPTNDLIGDGVYTFKVEYNDTWTVFQTDEVRVQFALKNEYAGLVYDFGYNPGNRSFFIKEGYGGGIVMHQDRSSFKTIGRNEAEVYIAISFTKEFLTQDYFDVTFKVNTISGFIAEETREDWLHVEMDLTFDKGDIKVLRGVDEVQRGAYLSEGPSLVITGARVVFDGTDVSPINEQFHTRLYDSRGRIFENFTSAGKDIYFEIPTNVDSGIYRFNIYLIIEHAYAFEMEDLSAIPEYYLSFDFVGPEAPPNLAFHADSLNDPEGRWDNDPQIWGTWDPAFDTQVGIDHYEYRIEGPDGFTMEDSATEFSAEMALAGDGVYYIYVWAVDKVGNPGIRSMKTVIIDSTPIIIYEAAPSYTGEEWFNSEDVNIKVKIKDTVLDTNGPFLELKTLQFAITEDMTLTARDHENTQWMRPKYTIIQEVKEETDHTYTLSVNIPNLNEGKNNFVWFKIMDQAGNEGITPLIDQSDPNYEENATMFNPANVWVDITPITYTDPTPTEDDILEENVVTPTVIINDAGSGVDASSIQYSVSRNGLTNFGGWISANVINDGNTILVETVVPLLFQPGSINYVRWKAMDLAGNGYTISSDMAIRITDPIVNNPPIALITTPTLQAVYDTRETISFDATDSSDPDFDTLTYSWVHASKEQISDQGAFEIEASELGRGIHVITLYVSDGDYIVTEAISIFIKQHPDELDTDNDNLADGADTDDDNDGLLDTEEAEMGTNPRLKDTDQDGVYDSLDEQPLNPKVGLPDEREGEYSYWDILILFLILAVFLILIGSMVVFKRRATMEKDRVMRNVVQEGKIVQRYEVLTGVDAPLLPQVKEMGMTLPPVAAQQVVPIKRAKALTETPSLPPTAEAPAPAPEPTEAPQPAPAPEPAPEPKPVRRERTTAAPGSTPGAVPTPEELTKTAALPGEGEQAPAQTTNCDLCGSSIDVPAGAASVECPLCGEKKAL